MNKSTEEWKPSPVPFKAKQDGEAREQSDKQPNENAPVRLRWQWAEPSVWTERMLTALEKGVKGGKWFSLIDKVWTRQSLMASFLRVKRNGGSPGVDHVTIEMFERKLSSNLRRLEEQLREGTYVPQAILRKNIPKPGSKETRPLGIPTVRDRVVQGALRFALEPIFERDFAEQSYGFRPKRSCKDALDRVEQLLVEGNVWVLDADLKSYFDTIPHDRLVARVEEKIADGRVLDLIKAFLKQGILDGLEEWTPEEGTPQGAVISPMLSNLYLNPLDHLMAKAGFNMVRYADDFVVLCATESEAKRALERIREWVSEAGLTLHPDKTRLVDARVKGEGFDFLGYHFERGQCWPRKKSMRKIKEKLRPITKRCNGHSLEVIILKVNRTTKGWFGYFKHSNKWTFSGMDGWIRGRLRAILRKRRKRKGRARGRDHQRWPNAFFAKHGLFSLTVAHAEVCQSSRR